MEMTVIKCHLAADSPSPEALLPCFPCWMKRPPSYSIFFFELLHSSALLFVPQSSHSRPADIRVSLSSIAPSEWLSLPSEDSLYFLGLESDERGLFHHLCQFHFQERLIVWFGGHLATVLKIPLWWDVHGCGPLHGAAPPPLICSTVKNIIG